MSSSIKKLGDAFFDRINDKCSEPIQKLILGLCILFVLVVIVALSIGAFMLVLLFFGILNTIDKACGPEMSYPIGILSTIGFFTSIYLLVKFVQLIIISFKD